MKVFGAYPHDPIVFVECNDFSSHSVIFFLSFASAAVFTGATVLTDHSRGVTALHALFPVFVFHEGHLLLLSTLDVGLTLVLLGNIVAYEFS